MSFTPNPTVTTGGDRIADVTDRELLDVMNAILMVLQDIRSHLDLMNETEVRNDGL